MLTLAYVTEKIKDIFYPTYAPSVTVIKYQDGQEFYGFFQDFDDDEELLEKGQCRFIPNDNSSDYRTETQKTGRINPKFSIIVDFKRTSNISLIERGITLREVNFG